MKKKWKDLSKATRKFIIVFGLLNSINFLFQVFFGSFFSGFLTGVGLGVYYFSLLVFFGHIRLDRLNPDFFQEVSGDE